MRPTTRLLLAPSTALLLVAGLASCGDASTEGSAAGADAGASSPTTGGTSGGTDGAGWTPVTVEHALGTTTVEEAPERVATVGYANHEVPLALGVVPVGMAASTWGDDDGDGVMPWVAERLEELGAQTPVLFDETDGIDFEAVADTDPDVILAAYSGLTQEDYDTLRQIAPVVAYPEAPWATPWRETITTNAAALGMDEEADQLVADLEADIAAAVAEHPQVEGATGMFLTHVDPTDLSSVSFYTTADTRTQFLEDIGMELPQSLVDASGGTEEYSGSVSAEQADAFSDVDAFVTYGGDELLGALDADPLLSQIRGVETGAVVNLPGDQPLGNAANPTALSLPYLVDDYVAMLGDAVERSTT